MIPKEIKQELTWALDNISPWDPFWSNVKAEWVIELTGITPGGNKALTSRKKQPRKKKSKKRNSNSHTPKSSTLLMGEFIDSLGRIRRKSANKN